MADIVEDVDPGPPARVYGMFCFACLGSSFTGRRKDDGTIDDTGWRCSDCGHGKVCLMTNEERDTVLAKREAAD